MFKVDQFGKDAYEVTLSVKDGQAHWQNRLFQVFAAAPEGLPNGSGSIPAWFNFAAGAGPVPNIDADWREPIDVTTWDILGTAGKDFLNFLKAAKRVARKDAPRNYATVIAIGDEACATDGFRLVHGSVGFTSLVETICIPVSCIKAIEPAVKAAKALEVRLSSDRTTLALIGDTVRVYVRLSAVKFPQYKAILPKEVGIEIGAAEIDAARVAAKLQAKVKPTKEYCPHVKIGGQAFNPNFVLDMPESESYRLLPEAEMLLSIGKIQTVLVGIKLAA